MLARQRELADREVDAPERDVALGRVGDQLRDAKPGLLGARPVLLLLVDLGEVPEHVGIGRRERNRALQRLDRAVELPLLGEHASALDVEVHVLGV